METREVNNFVRDIRSREPELTLLCCGTLLATPCPCTTVVHKQEAQGHIPIWYIWYIPSHIFWDPDISPPTPAPAVVFVQFQFLQEIFNRSLLIKLNYVFLSVSCHVHPHEFASVSITVQTQDLVHSMNWSLWCFTPTDKKSTQIPSRWVVFYQRGWSLQLKSNFSRNIFPI